MMVKASPRIIPSLLLNCRYKRQLRDPNRTNRTNSTTTPRRNVFVWGLSLVTATLLPFFAIVTLFSTGNSFSPTTRLYFRGNQASTQIPMTVHDVESDIEDETPIMCSLWLMPSTDMMPLLQKEIDELAEMGHGPTFAPHVTIVGNIPCLSNADIKKKVQALRDGLSGFGSVPCHFAKYPTTSPGQWSQAMIFNMEETALFIELCNRSRELLGMNTENWTFAPPVRKPHMSVYYGEDKDIPSPDSAAPIPYFESPKIELWKTNPATLAGVPDWELVGEVELR